MVKETVLSDKTKFVFELTLARFEHEMGQGKGARVSIPRLEV